MDVVKSEFSDNFLICRGSTLYRANIAVLSNLYATFNMKKSASDEIARISAVLENVSSKRYLTEHFYTNSEANETFLTQDELSAFSNNENYVKTTAAAASTSSLITEKWITSKWTGQQLSGNANYLISAYNYIASVPETVSDRKEVSSVGEISKLPDTGTILGWL